MNGKYSTLQHLNYNTMKGICKNNRRLATRKSCSERVSTIHTRMHRLMVHYIFPERPVKIFYSNNNFDMTELEHLRVNRGKKNYSLRSRWSGTAHWNWCFEEYKMFLLSCRNTNWGKCSRGMSLGRLIMNTARKRLSCKRTRIRPSSICTPQMRSMRTNGNNTVDCHSRNRYTYRRCSRPTQRYPPQE